MAADKAQAKQFDAARKLWTEFLAKYPLDPRDPGILYAFGLMEFQQEKFTAAIDDWRRLVSKYPGTEDASRGQYMIAVTLETKLGKLDEALKEYKKVESGSYTSHAQVAIARLTAKSMAIATERVFRSDETPKIKLTSRNIESVTVRAYKVDLETYFRKMHLQRRRGARYLADRSGQDVRVQGAEVCGVSGAGEPDRGAARSSRRRTGEEVAAGRGVGRHRVEQDARSHDARACRAISI